MQTGVFPNVVVEGWCWGKHTLIIPIVMKQENARILLTLLLCYVLLGTAATWQTSLTAAIYGRETVKWRNIAAPSDVKQDGLEANSILPLDCSESDLHISSHFTAYIFQGLASKRHNRSLPARWLLYQFFFLHWAQTLLSFSDAQVIDMQKLFTFFHSMTENLLFGKVKAECH